MASSLAARAGLASCSRTAEAAGERRTRSAVAAPFAGSRVGLLSPPAGGRRAGHAAAVPRAEQPPPGSPPPPNEPQNFSSNTRLRGEAMAPFRTFRQFAFGALGANASLGFAITLPRLLGNLASGAEAAITTETAQNLAIDLAVAGVCGFLFYREQQAANRQMSRISREETLGQLRVELSTRKTLPLSQLRGASRVLIVAGNAEQLRAAAAAAAPFKEALLERAVTLVLVPLDPTDMAALAVASEPVPAEDKRWRVIPLRVSEWAAWLREQMGQAGKDATQGVYLSLRLDGRVRASGVGGPPYARLAAELATWKGALDGFDGSVNSLD